FCVIRLVTKRAGKLSEVDSQTFTDVENVSAIRLPKRAISLRARLVRRITLDRLRRLAVLQVEPHAPTPAPFEIRRAFDNNPRLIQTKTVRLNVVSAQQVDAADGPVEVVAVITVERDVYRRVAEEVEGFAIGLFEGNWLRCSWLRDRLRHSRSR